MATGTAPPTSPPGPPVPARRSPRSAASAGPRHRQGQGPGPGRPSPPGMCLAQQGQASRLPCGHRLHTPVSQLSVISASPTRDPNIQLPPQPPPAPAPARLPPLTVVPTRGSPCPARSLSLSHPQSWPLRKATGGTNRDLRSGRAQQIPPSHGGATSPSHIPHPHPMPPMPSALSQGGARSVFIRGFSSHTKQWRVWAQPGEPGGKPPGAWGGPRAGWSRVGFTKPRERVQGDRDENPRRNSPGMDRSDPGPAPQGGRGLPPSSHTALECRARHGGAAGSPHPGEGSGGCPRAGGYCWMLLVSGGIPRVSPPARGGTVL